MQTPKVLNDGVSLLAEAISNDDEDLASLLKESGAVEVTDEDPVKTDGEEVAESEEWKQLLEAAHFANPIALKEAISLGADVSHMSAEGSSALSFLLGKFQDKSSTRTLLRNTEQCIDILLRHGANPSKGDPSPFVLAAMGRRMHIVQAMLSAGVGDIDQNLGEGQTALFMSLLAPDSGQPADDRCALVLLKAGADSSLRHESGAMPIHLAAASNYLGALQELLDRRPQDVDAKTNIGLTPLMMAATEGHADAVDLLLKFGADRTIKDDEGLTAKDVAIKNGSKHLVATLS